MEDFIRGDVSRKINSIEFISHLTLANNDYRIRKKAPSQLPWGHKIYPCMITAL
jgi:hypothetical protein